MKKAILFISMLCLLTSCQKNEIKYTTINENTQELSKSMKHYFNTEALAETQGEMFQAKLLKASHLHRHTSDYDTYDYKIVIAPSSTKVEKFGNIFFSPDTSILPYMDDTKIGMTTLAQSNEIFQNVSYHKMKTIKDYTAFQYDIKMDVLNKESMIEEKMKYIEIDISYNNGQKEMLKLDFKQIAFDHQKNQVHTGVRPFE